MLRPYQASGTGQLKTHAPSRSKPDPTPGFPGGREARNTAAPGTCGTFSEEARVTAPSPKTLAMRILDRRGIAYEVVSFPETIHDALGVAAHAGLPAAHVFKTLVVLADEPRRHSLLVLVPAGTSLDLRRAAGALGVKRLRMATQAEAEKLTDLKVGGISPLALLSKPFEVHLDRSAEILPWLVVSAGKRGLNLRMRVDDFRLVTGAQWLDAARPEETG